MDDLINQIKQGGVKLKSTKSHSVGSISKKPEMEEKEKPADAVQEMKSILATLKRGRHGRLKPSEISQGSKFRPKLKNEKGEPASHTGSKVDTLNLRNEDTSCSVSSDNVASQLRGNTSTTEDFTSHKNQIELRSKKEEETEIHSNGVTMRGSSVEGRHSSQECAPFKESDTTASASYTLRLTCPTAGDNECSSREVTPPRRSEEQESSRPLSGRAITSTTIFLSGQTLSQD